MPGWIAVRIWWRLIASCTCPFLGPFPSVGGGAHRTLTTLCPSSPCLAYPYLPTHPTHSPDDHFMEPGDPLRILS